MKTLEYSDFLTSRIDYCLCDDNKTNLEKINTLNIYKKNYGDLLANNYLPLDEVERLKNQLRRIDDNIKSLS